MTPYEVTMSNHLHQSGMNALIIAIAHKVGLTQDEILDFIFTGIDLATDVNIKEMENQKENMNESQKLLSSIFGIDMAEKANDIINISNKTKNAIMESIKKAEEEEE